jgi:hypothetical protein
LTARIALACAIGTLRARYLHIRCRCGWTTSTPIKLMLAEGMAHPDQTVADVLVRLRCGSRGHKGDLVVHLCEDVYGPGDNLPAAIKLAKVRAGWRVERRTEASQWSMIGTKPYGSLAIGGRPSHDPTS